MEIKKQERTFVLTLTPIANTTLVISFVVAPNKPSKNEKSITEIAIEATDLGICE